MKLQILNGSFNKVLATVAIAFVISAAPAQAQQGQWGADRCYYLAQGGQWVRQGCAMATGGGQFYYDFATQIVTDYRTNYEYFMGQNGRWLIYTAAGWMDLQTYATQVAAANQARDPNFAASYGAGKVGGVYAGSGSMTLGALANVSNYSQLNTLRQRVADTHTWDAPDNTIYVRAR